MELKVYIKQVSTLEHKEKVQDFKVQNVRSLIGNSVTESYAIHTRVLLVAVDALCSARPLPV